MSALMRACIYAGRGICHESISGIKATLARLPLGWEVVDFVVREGRMVPDPTLWERKTTLYVLPGGRCSVWDEELSCVIPKIRGLVEEGDALLGICAGSYYAAEESTYRWSKRETGRFERGLSLFKGVAEGPLYFQPESLTMCGVSWEPKTALQRWEEDGSEVPVLVLGGPHYLPKEGQVLARIVEGDQTFNAVVKSTCGLGISILMNWCPGVTIDPDALESYQRGFPLFNWSALVQPPDVEEARLASFARILTQFN